MSLGIGVAKHDIAHNQTIPVSEGRLDFERTRFFNEMLRVALGMDIPHASLNLSS